MNNLDQAVYAYELPTNVDFGRDEDSTVLYVPSGKSVYRITLNSEGYQLLASNLKPRACASLPWVARLEPGDVDFQHRRSVASLPAATLLSGFGTSGMVALGCAFRCPASWSPARRTRPGPRAQLGCGVRWHR
jgi:hypothetical protein